MSKKQPIKKPAKPRKAKTVKNEIPVHNGLSEAIMGFEPGGIGTQLDQVDTVFANNRWYLISNMRQVLSEIYAEHGLIQTVVDVPVDDGLRGGVEIKTKQLSEEQIHTLMAALERNNDINIVGQAMKWNRLYGGAGVVIMTDQDPESPLDIDAIGADTPLEFRALDMWELFWDKQNAEAYNPQIQEHDFEFYSYYGTKLHKSRVMKMKGIQPPSFIRPRLRGWGLSVIESLVRSINQYFKTNDLCFEVLDEFKLDIFKIKNLTSTLMSATGTAQVQQRVALANKQKNYQNAITMDAEDDYVQKQLSFSGIAEILAQIRIQIAGDLRMPITKIFGISATGFNSGQDDIENYNAMIESTIRSKCKYDILKIIEIRCQKLFGFIPTDLTIEFEPLRILSQEQEENVKTQKFNRVFQAVQSGLITTEQFRNAVNRDQLLEIQLEAEDLVTAKYDEDIAQDGSTEQPEHDKDYSRASILEGEKNDGTVKNYFTKADHIKIPFEKDYHPRDEKGVFRTEGKTSEKVKLEKQYERRKEKIEEGSKLCVVVWSEGEESRTPIFVREVSPAARDKIVDEFKGTKYKVESYGGKHPNIEEGKSYPLEKKENQEKIVNPGKVDEALWEKAKKAVQEEYGKLDYAIVTAIYKKMGGEFHKEGEK